MNILALKQRLQFVFSWISIGLKGRGQAACIEMHIVPKLYYAVAHLKSEALGAVVVQWTGMLAWLG